MLLILELCICKNEDGPKNEDPPLKKNKKRDIQQERKETVFYKF